MITTALENTKVRPPKCNSTKRKVYMTGWHTREIRILNSEKQDLEQLTQTHSTDLHETDQTLREDFKTKKTGF